MTWILAIDLGNGGPKVAAVAPTGEILATAFHPVSVNIGRDGTATQDALEWEAALRAAIAQVTGDVDPDELAAIGITGQWGSTVPVGADGDPVGPVRGQRGNPARGQHRGQARVIVFEADRGKHQGKIGERPGGLERAQRAAVGRVDEPLADHLFQTVEQGVDQLIAEVGHRHRVGVGIEQGHGQPARPLLADRPLFFR